MQKNDQLIMDDMMTTTTALAAIYELIKERIERVIKNGVRFTGG